MEIRELNENDLESLLELYVQLDPDNKNYSIQKMKILWKEIASNKNIRYFGAVEDDKVVSTCYCVIIPNLTKEGRPVCFIENVVTNEQSRNRGLGRKVIEKAVETAEANNCYKVILQSGSARKQAHEFYRNLGFDDTTKIAFDMRL